MSRADIAFSAHAFVLSAVSLAQTYWYGRERGERDAELEDEATPLIETSNDALKNGPRKKEVATLWTKLSIPAIVMGLAVGGLAVKLGKLQAIDLVYYVSYVKIYIR